MNACLPCFHISEHRRTSTVGHSLGVADSGPSVAYILLFLIVEKV